MAEKNQLHQLLAVESSLKVNSKNLFFDETKTTLEKKQDHFDGVVKIYASMEESGDQIPPEIKEIVTTVSDKLNYAKQAVVKALDAEVSKEETNSSGAAKAELKVGDKSFGTFSATGLMTLERNLETIRSVYKSIPTLDPTKKWIKDKNSGSNIYTTEEEVKFRTIKRNMPMELSKATDKHPAQVQVVTNDVQVGKYLTTYKSGRISTAQKSDILARIDELILAVKKARAEANQAQVVNIKIGGDLFDYIHGDIL